MIAIRFNHSSAAIARFNPLPCLRHHPESTNTARQA